MNKFFCSIGEKLSKEIPDTSNAFLSSAAAGKVGMPILAPSLSEIFNVSMSKGLFPND